MNPQIKQAFSDLGEICAQTQDLVDHLSAQALKKCLSKKSRHEVRLDAGKLSRMHPAIGAQVISLALGLLGGGKARFGSSHIAAIRDLLFSMEEKPQTHLPASVVAVKEKRMLRIFDTSHK